MQPYRMYGSPPKNLLAHFVFPSLPVIREALALLPERLPVADARLYSGVLSAWQRGGHWQRSGPVK